MENLFLETRNQEQTEPLLEHPVGMSGSIQTSIASATKVGSINTILVCEVSDICIQANNKQYWLLHKVLSDNLSLENSRAFEKVNALPAHSTVQPSSFQVRFVCELASLAISDARLIQEV